MSVIAKGMVVQLVSGGPKMAVHNLSDYSESGGPTEGAICVWFVDGAKREDVFDIAVLKQFVEPSIRM